MNHGLGSLYNSLKWVYRTDLQFFNALLSESTTSSSYVKEDEHEFKNVTLLQTKCLLVSMRHEGLKAKVKGSLCDMAGGITPVAACQTYCSS